MAIGIFPENAMAGFGREVRQQAEGWGRDLIQAENARQVSNARAEMIDQWSAFEDYMNENEQTPSDWFRAWEAEQDNFQKAVLSHTSQPGAENYVRDMLTERMANFRDTIKERAKTKIMQNATRDFSTRIGKYTESRFYTDETDLMETLEAIGDDFQGAWNNGEPNVDNLPNEIVFKDLRGAAVKKVISDYLLQHPGDNDREIMNPNVFLQEQGIDLTEFTPDEIAELKKRYLAEKNIAEGEANARAEVFDRDTRKKILAGGPVLPTLRDEILNNPDLSGPQMNTLINLYDSRVDGTGKTYSNQEKLAAYAEIVEEDDPAKKLQLLFKHAGAFTPEKAQSLYDSINNPKVSDIEDSSAGEFLKKLVEQAGFGTDVALVATQRGYMLLKDAIDSAEKPLTDDEKKQKALELFNNLKEDVLAGKIDVHPVSLKKLREPGEVPLGLTLGLQEIWDQLDDASKLAAVNLRARGATAEQLIAHFKKKTGK